MALHDCPFTAPHRKHSVLRSDPLGGHTVTCYGIPSAEELLRDKRKAERKALKADLKHARKMLRLEAKWDKIGRMPSTRTADDRL